MKNEEVNIYKVLFSVKLRPSSEISMKVFKAKAVERGNSYLVIGIEFRNGEMEELTNNKTIPKTNLMVTSGFNNADSVSQSLWCLEEQLPEAKEICMEKMHDIIKRNLDQATRMSIIFQSYKHESKK